MAREFRLARTTNCLRPLTTSDQDAIVTSAVAADVKSDVQAKFSDAWNYDEHIDARGDVQAMATGLEHDVFVGLRLLVQVLCQQQQQPCSREKEQVGNGRQIYKSSTVDAPVQNSVIFPSH